MIDQKDNKKDEDNKGVTMEEKITLQITKVEKKFELVKKEVIQAEQVLKQGQESLLRLQGEHKALKELLGNPRGSDKEDNQ